MELKDWSKLWYHPQLDLESYQAVYIKRYFPSHMHDHYVLCFIEKGLQSFSNNKGKYFTPAGGLIILNPGDAHTGEPVDEYGFEYRGIYPTLSHMQEVVFEITGKQRQPPSFPNLRIDDFELARYIRALHLALINETSTMECESLFLIVLSRTIMKYADLNLSYLTPGKEHRAVKSACRYILERAAERITLDDIAKCVNLSRYYFLRVFHKEIGILPHAYLESVRISKAKRLLKKGNTINQVAYEAGFSDQSHFTNCFKRLIGITPGQYVRDIRI